MPKSLRSDDPNLILAANRLKRTLRVWAGLFAGVGLLTLVATQGRQPVSALPWLAGAVLLARGEQPAWLALTAVQWGLSLIMLLPEAHKTLGPDPLAYLTNSGVIETLALVVVRLILMVTAWNQFLFYRMLYGTEATQGLGADSAPIPEVIPNRTNRIARTARSMGFFSILFVLAAVPLRTLSLEVHSIGLAISMATFSLGLGLGAAFSPTNRRGEALVGVGTGVLGYLMSLIAGRLL